MIKKHKDLIIKIVFCLLLSLLLLTYIDFNSYYIGQDGLFHINRLEGIVKAFEDGQILTKVYPYTNNGYGYAVSLFYCDLLLYPFAILYKLGLPLITSYVAMIIFYSSFSIFAMMWASSKIFNNNKYASYIATFLFAICNYRIADIYARNALGEVLATCFIPIVFYALYSIFVKKENNWIALGISYGGIAITHNITLLIYGIYFAIIFIIFIIIERDRNTIIKAAKTSFKGALLAILLSSFYLIPLLEQILSQEFLSTKYYVNEYHLALTTLSWRQLLNIYFVNGNLNYIPNIGTVITLTPFLYFCIKNKNKTVTSLLIIYILSLLCLIGLVPIIFKISFLNITQFIWRIFIFIFPLAVLLSTYVLINMNKKVSILILVIAFVTSVFMRFKYDAYVHKYDGVASKIVSYHIKHDDMYNYAALDDSFYYNYFELAGGEYLPPTESYDYLKETTYIKKINGNDFDEIKDENNEYLEYKRFGTHISFNYDSKGNEQIMAPLIYYKGYSVYADKKSKPIKLDINKNNKYKQVVFKTLAGEHEYTIHYDGTIVQCVSLGLSFITLLCTIFILIYRKRK